MKLKEIEEKFKNKEIDKQEYIKLMHVMHQSLFEYSEFVKGRDIRKIEISDDCVILTSRNNFIKMICDKEDKRIIPVEILNFAYYEKTELDMVMNLADETSTVFDIGANIGWYSLNIAKNKKNTKVFSFEPIPKTFDYLKRNVKLNQIKNIEIFNFGFSYEERDIEFYYYKEGSGNASLANLSDVENIHKIICSVKKLDDFVYENRYSVDFIKCDVEGAELLVLKGGIETIKRDKPIIFMEMLRKWTSKFNYHPNDIIKLLTNEGYRTFTAKKNRLLEFFNMDEDTVETNFFFLHSYKHIDKIKKFEV
jgi:FkbM family methyltransferase